MEWWERWETWLRDVAGEMDSQFMLWGEKDHDPFKWLTILMEEAGEAAQAALGNREQKYRDELIQVAAVALSAVNCMDRQRDDLADDPR